MRTIKFRGKSMLDEQWVTGDLVHAVYEQKQKEVYCIADGEYKKEELDDDSEDGCDWGYKLGKDIFPVYKETIGQYTGMNDKNGKEIYEGDVVILYTITSEGLCDNRKGMVMFSNGCFYANLYNDSHIHAFPLYKKNGVLIFPEYEVPVSYEVEVVGNMFDNHEILKQNESNAI